MRVRVLKRAGGLLGFFSVLLAVGGAEAQATRLLVVNQSDASVSVVDPATLTVEARISENLPGKVHVHEVAVSADGKTAYLPVYGDVGVGKAGVDGRSLLLLDLPSRSIVGAVDFGRGVRPHQPIVDPATGLLYVSTELDDSITVIDPKTRSIVGRVPTGADQSHMFALSHDGRLGYTSNVGPGSVSVLDMKARKTLAVIPVAGGVQRIALSRNDRSVFTSDADAPRLAMIDTATRKLDRWIPLPSLGYGLAATPDGRWLLITLPALNQVGVIDLRALKLVRTLDVGQAPQEIVISRDGRTAYVSCARGGGVSVLDLREWKTIGAVATGPGADGLALTP